MVTVGAVGMLPAFRTNARPKIRVSSVCRGFREHAQMLTAPEVLMTLSSKVGNFRWSQISMGAEARLREEEWKQDGN
jgi:hypothetical protein